MRTDEYNLQFFKCKHTGSWFSQESIINPFILVNEFIYFFLKKKKQKKTKTDALLPGSWCLFSQDLEATMDAGDISLLNTACVTKVQQEPL
jgi:hypothetical protein